MSMLPELLGEDPQNKAARPAITFRGRRYPVKFLTLTSVETLEVQHFEEAKQRLERVRNLYSVETFEKKVDVLYQRYDDGEFSVLTQGGRAWLKTPAGFSAMIRLILDVTDEDMLPLLTTKQDEVLRTVDQVMKESGFETVHAAAKAKAVAQGSTEENANAPFCVGQGN